MKIAEYKNGKLIYRASTPEEDAETERRKKEQSEIYRNPTPDERLDSVEHRTDALESGNSEILEALDMLLSGVTE